MANEKKGAIERFAESAFMKKLQVGSQKLASSEIFSTISGGMGATMGLIMIGAVIQIVCAVGAMFGWDTSSASYQAFYMPYKLTMGLMGFFMAFSMSWNFAKRKKMNQMQSVITALVSYILVVSPPVSASTLAADGSVTSTFDALNLGKLGTGGLFVAIIVGLCSVAISKFVIDHDWTIKLPDAVPEGIANSFNAIIPMGVNIIVWYGISLIISAVSGGTLTLATLITVALSVPVNFLTSTPGYVLGHRTGTAVLVLWYPWHQRDLHRFDGALHHCLHYKLRIGCRWPALAVLPRVPDGRQRHHGRCRQYHALLSDGSQEQIQAHPGCFQGILCARPVRHQRACHLRLSHYV